jgi:hypothetical protein
LKDSAHSLEAWQGERIAFASSGRWLHPLLELERFLLASRTDPASLVLHDKIVGRAAALLIIRLRIPEVRAGLLSRLGERALRSAGVRCTYAALTDRIDCQTEEILENVDDPEEAHRIVIERARAAASRAGAGTV